MNNNLKRISNVEHKIISSKLSVCSICNKESPDFSNIEVIRSREKLNIGLLTKHLGRRSLDDKYSIKYPEDEPMKKYSKYIDHVTGKSPLWTICNCEKVVHPDCFLQSTAINFNYRCTTCNEVYRFGYKSTKFPKKWDYYFTIIIRLALAIALFVLFCFFITRNNNNFEMLKSNEGFIRFLRSISLICLILGIIIFSTIFTFIQSNPKRKEIEMYLLPFAFKYNLNFGVEKYEIIQTFRTGSTQGDKKHMITNALGQYMSSKDDNEGNNLEADSKTSFSYLMNCAFYQELMDEMGLLEKIPQNKREKMINEKFSFDYSISHSEIIRRFENYLSTRFNIPSQKEIIEIKIERENFFQSQIKRNNLEYREFVEISNIMTNSFKKKSVLTGTVGTYNNYVNNAQNKKVNLFNNQQSLSDKQTAKGSFDDTNLSKPSTEVLINKENKKIKIGKQVTIFNKQGIVKTNTMTGDLAGNTNRFGRQATKVVKNTQMIRTAISNNLQPKTNQMTGVIYNNQNTKMLKSNKSLPKTEDESKNDNYFNDMINKNLFNVEEENKTLPNETRDNENKSFTKSNMNNSLEGIGIPENNEEFNTDNQDYDDMDDTKSFEFQNRVFLKNIPLINDKTIPIKNHSNNTIGKVKVTAPPDMSPILSRKIIIEKISKSIISNNNTLDYIKDYDNKSPIISEKNSSDEISNEDNDKTDLFTIIK